MTASRYRWLGYIAAWIPALLPLWLILRDGVDVHFLDEWDPNWAGVVLSAYHHQATFSQLVAQHNEHRIVLPRLIWIAISPFTHWNAVDDLLLAWGIVCLTSLAILRLCRMTGSRAAAILWFLCNLLLFTPMQDENWMWGIGLANMLPAAFLCAGLAVVGTQWRAWTKSAICLILATAATFSNGNGALCWPLLGAALAWSICRQKSRGGKWILTLWAIACAINLALYLHNYHSPTFGGQHSYRATLFQKTEYCLVFLGNPFAQTFGSDPALTAETCGTILLLLLLIAAGYFLYALRNRRTELCDRMLPWLLLASCTLISAALASHSRAGWGASEALVTRYVTASLYLPIALVNLLPMIAGDFERRSATPARWIRIPLGILGAGIIALQLANIPAGIQACHDWRASLRSAKGAILLVNILPENPQLEKIYPDPSVLSREANGLDQIGYMNPRLIQSDDADLIRAADPAEASGASGNFDGYIPGTSGEIKLVGWAIFAKTVQPADAVFVTYQNDDGEPIICALADMGLSRQDIVQQTGQSNYLRCGWLATFPVSRLPRDLKIVRLNAWVLDVNSAKAVRLNGIFAGEDKAKIAWYPAFPAVKNESS